MRNRKNPMTTWVVTYKFPSWSWTNTYQVLAANSVSAAAIAKQEIRGAEIISVEEFHF